MLTANSGEEGLELFTQHPVELVIADHYLSEKTGAEIAKEMKELKPEVPILILSAAAERPDGLEFVDGFVPKGEPPYVASRYHRSPAGKVTAKFYPSVSASRPLVNSSAQQFSSAVRNDHEGPRLIIALDLQKRGTT